MKETTLGFLLREKEVLLAMKKRGFGVGKWNGFGGKREAGETFLSSLVREAKEEIGVHIREEDIREAGMLHFYFLDTPEWDTLCKVYTTLSWEGEPRESEEMAPLWFSIHALPFENMWIDDSHWLPFVLMGKYVDATFSFSEKGSVITEQKIHVA